MHVCAPAGRVVYPVVQKCVPQGYSRVHPMVHHCASQETSMCPPGYPSVETGVPHGTDLCTPVPRLVHHMCKPKIAHSREAEMHGPVHQQKADYVTRKFQEGLALDL